MKRNAIKKLITWKEQSSRKSMWITGIKSVGKTFLALDFAKSFYEGNLYVNFETNAAVCNLFQKAAYSIENELNIIELLYQYYEIPLELSGNLLIILDEITFCKEAMEALNHYLMNVTSVPGTPVTGTKVSETKVTGNNVPILVLSSEFIEVDDKFFDSFTLYPMEFDEFLVASGDEWYAEVIKGHYQTNRKIPEIVHKELLTIFEDYLLVGGMPAAVSDYITMENTNNVAEIHQRIYLSLLASAKEKHSESDALKLSQVCSVMVEQLLKENKKFQYRLIRKGATYAHYKDVIQYLVTNSLVYKCSKGTYDKTEGITISPEALQFKLYVADVGILNTLIRKNSLYLDNQNEMIEKTILDNYIMQSLIARGYLPNFWESNSQAKIDFLIQNSDGVIPLEIKTNENTRSKSVSIFRTAHDIPYSIKISNRNYEYSNQVKHLPYYAMFCL
ncbi:DUF4143 domain-containing protein [Lachnoclostridium sp.]|nr:DUF4143 domain-containing protein [Lachnoclostridium sp.]